MKKTTQILTVALMLMISAIATAETVTQQDLIGTWKVWAESHGKDKEKKLLANVWNFNEAGVLHAVSKDLRTDTLDFSTSYKVENGVLLKERMGRPGKFEHCVIDLKGAEMVLGCGNMYYFLTKTIK
jgi:hypothetical protein